jgi:hypothetical protein
MLVAQTKVDLVTELFMNRILVLTARALEFGVALKDVGDVRVLW